MAPWVRTRLRTAPGAAVAIACLVALTAFLAAACPRAVEAYENEALRAEIAAMPAPERALRLSALNVAAETGSDGGALTGAALRGTHDSFLSVLPAPLRADASESAYGVRATDEAIGSDDHLPAPEGVPPRFVLDARAEVEAHSRLSAGRHPAAVKDRAADGVPLLEAAVSTRAARVLKLRVGSEINLAGGPGSAPARVRITGILAPRDPRGFFWAVDPRAAVPAKAGDPATGNGPPPPKFWVASLLLAPDAGEALARVSTSERYVELSPLTAPLAARDAEPLRDAIANIEDGPQANRLRQEIGTEALVTTGLEQTVADYLRIRGAVTPVVAVAGFGVGAVAAITVAMTGGLAAARRRSELNLLRSRGGSLAGIAARLAAETAVVAVPAAALGSAAAVLAVPDTRHGIPLLAAAAVALLACAALPLRACVRHRVPLLHGAREDITLAAPSRRRTVAELTLVVLAAAAVAALRERGTGGAGGSTDPLLSAAPVLICGVAALVLLRLYPLPLRLSARPAARLRGAVGFLSLARTGRSPAAQALPLLALLTALATAAFGGSVLAGVGDARERAATEAVGAEVRLEHPERVSPALARGLRALEGVREVVGAQVNRELETLGNGRDVTLVAVDPEAYARLATSAGLGAFDARALAGGRAIGSPGVGSGPREYVLPGGSFRVDIATTRGVTPAASGAEFVIVDRAVLPEDARLPDNVLLATGSGVDVAGLRKQAAAEGALLKSRVAELARYAASPLQAGAGEVYRAAVAAGAGFSVLALVLGLLQAAPERTALLARLRTMGLTRSQGRRLLVLEALPQALLAAGGGVLVGWAAIRLLSPGIDLGRLALAEALDTVRLRADPWSLLLPAAAVVLLATAVAAVQAWWTARHTSTTELRAGDGR